jgi:thiamine pyrophosphokinase
LRREWLTFHDRKWLNLKRPLTKGDTVSLLPLSSDVRGITLDGFEYPLTGAVMEVGVPYGISNRLTGARGTISVEEGYLLVILTLQSINGVDNFD